MFDQFMIQLSSKVSLDSSLHLHSHCYTLTQDQTIHSSLNAKNFGYSHNFHELPTARTTFLKHWCHQVTTFVKCLQLLCTDYGMKFKLLILTIWLLRMSILPLTLIRQFLSLFPKHSMFIFIPAVLLFTIVPYTLSLSGKQIQPATHSFPYIAYALDLSCISNNQNLSQGPEQ